MLKRTTLHAAVTALTALHFALPALADANLDAARALEVGRDFELRVRL